MRLQVISVAALALGWSIAPSSAQADALWWIVNSICVPHEQLLQDLSVCRYARSDTGPDKRFIVFTDLREEARVLLIPTARISGIEDPQILAADAPNFWQAAWEARKVLEERAGGPLARDEIGLAINSIPGRSQDQLHIHVGCIRQSVLRVLRSHESGIRRTWTRLGARLAGDTYQAIRVEAEDLRETNPFHLLAKIDGMVPKRMGDQTLVVIGAVFKNGRNGFYILSNDAEPKKGDLAAGEELLDDHCALTRSPG